MEGFPVLGKYDGVSQPDFSNANGLLSTLSTHMHNGVETPRYSETEFKTPTRLYPAGADKPPTSNAAFRLSFGLTLLEGGYFGQVADASPSGDPWYDEYAVDVVSGSATFGQAIRSNPNGRVADTPASSLAWLPPGPALSHL